MNPKWATVVQKDRFDHLLREHLLRQEDGLFQADEGHDPVEFDADPWLLYGAAHDKAMQEFLQRSPYDDAYDDGYYDWLEKQHEIEWDNTDPRESLVEAWSIAEIYADTQKWSEEERMWEWHETCAYSTTWSSPGSRSCPSPSGDCSNPANVGPGTK